MVERLWCHALQFLDNCRLSSDHANCHILDLYKFSDPTGILEIHKRLLAQPFMADEVDLKVCYYELIRMLINYEQEQSKDPEFYEYTKSISKIEGYQDLTNKLQRFLNQRFMLDIDQLNRKCEGETTVINDESKIKSKLQSLELKMEKIQEDNLKLKNAVSSLSSTNQVLEKEILDLKQRINSNIYQTMNEDAENLSSSVQQNSEELSESADVQNEAISKISEKMQSMINQANTLLINDATHLERISNLETQVVEVNGKLQNLESADLYLQEAHKVLTERTSLIEKYSKYIEEKVKLVTAFPTELSSCGYEELERRISSLENQAIRDQNHEKGQNSSQETVLHINEESINLIKEELPNNITCLDEKYTVISNKIFKIEELLSQQAKAISDYSAIFSDKYSKLLTMKENRSKETEITKLVTQKLSEIKKEEYLRYSRITDLTKIKPDNVCDNSKYHVMEFIEILVGMNKSMNQLVEDFLATQIQIKSLKLLQKNLVEQIYEQKSLHKSELQRLDGKVDSNHIKEACEFEIIKEITCRLDENQSSLCERITELEKVNNINRSPRRATEEDFSLESPLEGNKKNGRVGWFRGILGRQNCSCCC